MSLYYEAAGILSSDDKSGSLKSRIYGLKSAKSNPAQIYALIIEASKYDQFLAQVIDQSHLLEDEPKLTPLLALLLCHDHFFSKKGIAAPAKHPLRQAIESHKARLQSEFTRARLKRRCGSIDALKSKLSLERGGLATSHPRWIRLNTIKAQSIEEVYSATKESKTLDDVLRTAEVSWSQDKNIPHLLAFPWEAPVAKSKAYRDGSIILQDKASCFPAHLLLGDQAKDEIGDVIDGCAAPGNKTTHVAAMLREIDTDGTVYACERDATRSKTLQSMIAKAGADCVNVLAKQDFLALRPEDARFAKVTHLLLDPSCSGSGILRREDMPTFVLPKQPHANNRQIVHGKETSQGRKRKREHEEKQEKDETKGDAIDEEERRVDVTEERLVKLSNLQMRIVEHAMKFPAARRITYSTCSVHEQENEVVVSRLLSSEIAKTQSWRLVARSHQVKGMKDWPHRGVKATDDTAKSENSLNHEQLEACIRCYPDDEQGTMGFFVCLFERELGLAGHETYRRECLTTEQDDDWEGFD